MAAGWLRRWELYAIPKSRDDDFECTLAETFNEDPITFVFRRNAKSAVKFYEGEMQLPVAFYILPTAHRREGGGWRTVDA